MSIQEHLNKIRNAIYGREVRESIAKGIETAYNDASEKDNANMEVKMARGTHSNLNNRLDDMEETDQEVTAQLAQTDSKKVDKDGSGQVRWANIAQDAREQISGDKVAVVGKDSVITDNISNNAVTYEKTEFADEVAILAKNIQLDGDFSPGSVDDTVAEGWILLEGAISTRLENNAQYWTPTTLGSSSMLSTRRASWGEESKAGHMYYVAFEHANVSALRIWNESEFYEDTSADGRHSFVYTASSDDHFDFRFTPRTINVESFVKNLIVVDLTETFGVGKEPSLEYFDFILSILTPNGWFDGTVNLIDASKNGIISANDLKLFDPEDLMGSESVNDAIMDLLAKNDSNLINTIINGNFDEGTSGWRGLYSSINVVNGRLRFTPEGSNKGKGAETEVEMTAGKVYYVKVGYFKQKGLGEYEMSLTGRLQKYVGSGLAFYIHTFDNNEDVQSFSTVVTPTVSAESIAFRSGSLYEYADIDDVMVLDLTETFGAGNEPSKEFIDEFLDTNLDGWFDGSLGIQEFIKFMYGDINEKIEENVNGSGVGTDVETSHEVSLAKLENERLKEEVDVLKTNAQAIYNIKTDKPSDRQEISLKDTTSQQKLILHLHNRDNDGYDTVNDVYLPNAESNFSDIKITNDDGTILPYRVTYKTNDFDILVDSRLGYGRTASGIVVNSDGKMMRSFDYIRESNDGGRTWSDMPAFSDFNRRDSSSGIRITLMSADDTLFFTHDGYLYRSEKPYTDVQQVFDLGDSGEDSRAHISGKAMVQHPDGEIFFGVYQGQWHVRFYKSTDDGETWELSLDDGDAYQHVHGMYVDKYSNPVAVYAGIDGGGGVYKTTDKGESWVDLRQQSPDMPQATDYGVIYADPSGYRLLGGETPVVGGHSIIKTEDDVNFRPVLNSGISVNYVVKKNGKLFATGSGTNANDVGAVLVSEDEGESWETVYLTTPITVSGSVNDGYREMTVLNDQMLVGPQSGAVPYLRVFLEGNYAEIVVDVPAGSESVIVESGYAYTNIQPIYNDTEVIGDYLLNFNLNEGGKVIKESVSGKYFEGDFEWQKVGKHLSYFYPYISSPTEKLSLKMKSLGGYKIDSSSFDVAGGLTISFWARMDENVDVELFRTDLGDVLKLLPSGAGFRLDLNGVYKSQIAKNTIPGAFNKIDVTIGADGQVEVYNNGLIIDPRKYNSSDILSAINNSSDMIFLNAINSEDSYCIQHFSMRKGVISSEQLMAEYHSNISNNLF